MKENVKTLKEVREILKKFVETYNNRYYQGVDARPKEKVGKTVNVFRTVQEHEREIVETLLQRRTQIKISNLNEISYNGITFFKVPKFKGIPLAN
jgi:uncharacterized protein (DUF2344 family)